MMVMMVMKTGPNYLINEIKRKHFIRKLSDGTPVSDDLMTRIQSTKRRKNF